MPTAGFTAKPTAGAEWWGVNVKNQHATPVVMPSGGGTVTKIGVWLRGKDESCGFKAAVWNALGTVVMCQTAAQTATGAALAISASQLHETAVITPVFLAAGTWYVGFTRDVGGQMQFGFDNALSHTDEDVNASSPQPFTGGSTFHDNRRMGVYVVYEEGSATFVRRSGVWVKANPVGVRRSGVWSDPHSDVYVRRSGVWVKAT